MTQPKRVITLLAAMSLPLLCACAPRATRVQPVNGELKDEGNQVSSWCAAASPGYRVFIVGTGSSQTMSVVADSNCHGGPR